MWLLRCCFILSLLPLIVSSFWEFWNSEDSEEPVTHAFKATTPSKVNDQEPWWNFMSWGSDDEESDETKYETSATRDYEMTSVSTADPEKGNWWWNLMWGTNNDNKESYATKYKTSTARSFEKISVTTTVPESDKPWWDISWLTNDDYKEPEETGQSWWSGDDEDDSQDFSTPDETTQPSQTSGSPDFTFDDESNPSEEKDVSVSVNRVDSVQMENNGSELYKVDPSIHNFTNDKDLDLEDILWMETVNQKKPSSRSTSDSSRLSVRTSSRIPSTSMPVLITSGPNVTTFRPTRNHTYSRGTTGWIKFNTSRHMEEKSNVAANTLMLTTHNSGIVSSSSVTPVPRVVTKNTVTTTQRSSSTDSISTINPGFTRMKGQRATSLLTTPESSTVDGSSRPSALTSGLPRMKTPVATSLLMTHKSSTVDSSAVMPDFVRMETPPATSILATRKSSTKMPDLARIKTLPVASKFTVLSSSAAKISTPSTLMLTTRGSSIVDKSSNTLASDQERIKAPVTTSMLATPESLSTDSSSFTQKPGVATKEPQTPALRLITTNNLSTVIKTVAEGPSQVVQIVPGSNKKTSRQSFITQKMLGTTPKGENEKSEIKSNATHKGTNNVASTDFRNKTVNASHCENAELNCSAKTTPDPQLSGAGLGNESLGPHNDYGKGLDNESLGLDSEQQPDDHSGNSFGVSIESTNSGLNVLLKNRNLSYEDLLIPVTTSRSNLSDPTSMSKVFLVIGNITTQLNSVSMSESMQKASLLTVPTACVNHICEQECEPLLDGEYRCYCSSGFKLAHDNYTCEDVDECQTENGMCEMECANTPGSYYCKCWPGYELSLNMRDCVDIDECESDSSCPEDHHCLNNEGSFSCVLNYQGNKRLRQKLYIGMLIWFVILTVLEIACIVLACVEMRLDRDLKRLREEKEKWLEAQKEKELREAVSLSYWNTNNNARAREASPRRESTVSGLEGSLKDHDLHLYDKATSPVPSRSFDPLGVQDVDNIEVQPDLIGMAGSLEVHAFSPSETNSEMRTEVLSQPDDKEESTSVKMENAAQQTQTTESAVYATIPAKDSVNIDGIPSPATERKGSVTIRMDGLAQQNSGLDDKKSGHEEVSTDAFSPSSMSLRIRHLEREEDFGENGGRNSGGDSKLAGREPLDMGDVPIWHGGEQDPELLARRPNRSSSKLNRDRSVDIDTDPSSPDSSDERRTSITIGMRHLEREEDFNKNGGIISRGDSKLAGRESLDMGNVPVWHGGKQDNDLFARKLNRAPSKLNRDRSVDIDTDPSSPDSSDERRTSITIGMRHLEREEDFNKNGGRISRGDSKLAGRESLDMGNVPVWHGGKQDNDLFARKLNRAPSKLNRDHSVDIDTDPSSPDSSDERRTSITIGMHHLAREQEPGNYSRQLPRGLSKMRDGKSMSMDYEHILPSVWKESGRSRVEDTISEDGPDIFIQPNIGTSKIIRSGESVDLKDTPLHSDEKRESIHIRMDEYAREAETYNKKPKRGYSKLRATESIDMPFPEVAAERRGTWESGIEGIEEEEDLLVMYDKVDDNPLAEELPNSGASEMRDSGSIDLGDTHIKINPDVIHPALRSYSHDDDYNKKPESARRGSKDKPTFYHRKSSTSRPIYLPEDPQKSEPSSPPLSAMWAFAQPNTGSYQVGSMQRKTSTPSGKLGGGEFSKSPMLNRQITLPEMP